MPDGGSIRIGVAAVDLAAEEVAQGAVIPPGAWAVLSVVDQGGGIAPALLPRIFEPFFTTRRGQGGTGLGLSTVLGILRQSGGHVSVASSPGQGTAIRLWFPRSDAPAVADAAPVAEPVAPAARRILLVEDEPPLRLLARRALVAAGHEVQAAEDADAALAVIEGGFVPDVLVTDMTMPGEMDGLALAEALLERLPGLSVVLVSGYAAATVGEGLAGRGMRFLEKPFRMAELAAAVSAA
jgi:two-component system cell cycle sensor histidine kinase/response regulator CckA